LRAPPREEAIDPGASKLNPLTLGLE
jgi:hypothetical protein